MKVKCLIEEFYQYHDMENEVINGNAQALAERIESVLGRRETFCNCDVEEYVISLTAKRAQTADCKVITGCPHFYEQMIKATSYIQRNLLNL